MLYFCTHSTRIDAILRLAGEKGVRSEETSRPEIERMAGPEHRGLVLALEPGNESGEREFKEFLAAADTGKNPLIIILDSITDPHNYGAILRSADQFSADAVVVRERRSARETAVVAQSSAGALAYLRIFTVSNLVRSAEDMKKAGFWIFGAAMEGVPAPKANFKGPAVLVLGSEGSGIGRLLKERCDTLVSIPTAGHVDSLNVSVAAGILMYEIRRQQG